MRIGTSFDEGVAAVHAATGVPVEVIHDLLARSAVPVPPRVRLAGALLTLAGLGLVVLVGLRVAAVSWPERVGAAGLLTSEQVVAGKALPAFHVVGSADVKLAMAVRLAGSFRDTSKVIGSVTLRAIEDGAVVQQDHIARLRLPGDVEAGWEVITLPVAKGALTPGIEPGIHVTLLVVPRAGAPGSASPPAVTDAVVLKASDGDPASLTVTIPARMRDSIGPLLGRSEIYVTRPVHTSRP